MTEIITIKVGVAKDSVGKNKYLINDELKPNLQLEAGITYHFVLDESAKEHPFRISTSSDGIHSGGEEYQGAKIRLTDGKPLVIKEDLSKVLYYYCKLHPGMGNQVNFMRYGRGFKNRNRSGSGIASSGCGCS